MTFGISLEDVRIGQPQLIGTRPHGGGDWMSSIHKQSVKHLGLSGVEVTTQGIAGDSCVETTLKSDGIGQIHGGPDKAIYVYPADHYNQWAEFIEPGLLASRCFGENLSVNGAGESDVYIGDIWRIGDVELMITKPRTPCATLNSYFGRPMGKFMTMRMICGWYMSVVRPGIMPITWDDIEVAERGEGPSVEDVFRAKMGL